MNIFKRVTLQSLKKNKTRTIVTIIGIMLSTAMICAVTTFVSTMQNYALSAEIYSSGDWHGAVNNTDYGTLSEIKNTGEISAVTYNQIIGYAKFESKNPFKPYIYIRGAEKDSFFDMLPIHLTSGRYPQNETEIIIPEHLLTNGGMDCKIGDSITLNVGERLLDGYPLTQDNTCYTYDSLTGEDVLNDEIIEVREAITYKVVGIYERPNFEPRSAPGYTAITVADEGKNSEYKIDTYFKMKKPSKTYEFMNEMELSGSVNDDLLMLMGVFRFDGFNALLISLAAIVIGLIMFGSIALIYNAFAISVSERTKQFGLLSSIGATKKQLKKMVLFEALAVSAVGIPLGVVAGISGIGVTLLLIGNKFTFMFDANLPLKLSVSWEAVFVATIVALITVLISAFVPSKRATKISAVEAIRQNADIKAKSKKIKTSKLTYKLFGLSGVIASKHYKRNKRKYRTTVLSLFMSIVLFVSASSFTDYLTESVNDGISTKDYEIYCNISEKSLNGKSADEILQVFTSEKNVTDGAYTVIEHKYGTVKNKYVTDEFLKSLSDRKDENNDIACYVIFVNDEKFDTLIQKYKLDKKTYYNPQSPLAITIDENVSFDAAKQKFVTRDILKGDKFEMSCEDSKEIEGYYNNGAMYDESGNKVVEYISLENRDDVITVPYSDAYIPFTLKSGKTINDCPYYVERGNDVDIYMLYPISMLEFVFPKEVQSQTNAYRYNLKSSNHAESLKNLKIALLENNITSFTTQDIAESYESNRNLVIIIKVFSYGFIVLISLIAAANVFNTVSTNIALRRREFAMLKSVGMSQKDFNKMMNFECLLYGSRALILGLPVSAGITYLIYLSVSNGFETRYHLPWTAIAIAVLSVFSVVFVTMIYSMQKIKKDNPIDALKNENL